MANGSGKTSPPRSAVEESPVLAEPLQKHHVALIVENEMMIASFLQDAQERSGYGVAKPFVARASALEWLEKHTPYLAVICTMLNGFVANSEKG
jgi:hypothetical protein